MLFNSLDFLVFLPLACGLYYLLPARLRLPWLMLASLVFYGSFGWSNLAWLAVVVVITLVAARGLSTANTAHVRRLALTAGLAAILGLLVVLKFYETVAAAVAWLPALGLSAPAGFSFYVFMSASLLIDRYRNPPDDHPSAFLDTLYLVWFPKILAGPIERSGRFLSQLAERRAPSAALLLLGCQLIVWGLFKKVVIADNLAPYVDRIYEIPAYAPPMELAIATYFFAFQIYCDFSGYTDMAIGVSLLFGIQLAENFRRPYFAASASSFWSERWHISLARWFRDYLYFPLGGSRVGTIRIYANLMIVFLISGLWHAGLGYGVSWGFLVWGALNGFYVWGERLLTPLGQMGARRFPALSGSIAVRVISALVVFHLVLISWIFFRADSLADGWLVLTRIGAALPEFPSLLRQFPFSAEHGFLVGVIAALLLIELFQEMRPLSEWLAAMPVWLRWGAWYACLFAILILGRWQGEAFVYMQF